jgi:hypothetical protein
MLLSSSAPAASSDFDQRNWCIVVFLFLRIIVRLSLFTKCCSSRTHGTSHAAGTSALAAAASSPGALVAGAPVPPPTPEEVAAVVASSA